MNTNQIKSEIYKNNLLSELGVELYKLNNKDIECLDDAILFSNEKDRLKTLLKEGYGVESFS
ncbi:hypothetical protein [Clostridium estertheticum]|uniref:Uncharacterized protein n=1 Tax=Clostridium estertheticum TaxID=238834 RepID=A0AA47I462_9CLOT|nr:hypothetical protein [Clostridium estertheticum]MBU3156423.1 hypothetical protein [Clostridium estertheticum]WAG58882.1 hypothetical protein LL038_14635 [Clostridium estertheticum]